MFEGLKDMGKLVSEAKKMKSRMKEVQAELKKTIVVGKDRKNRVEIEMTGELECTNVTIHDISLLSAPNQRELQNALKEAINEATKKSKDLATKRLSEISGGLNIPGLT